MLFYFKWHQRSKVQTIFWSTMGECGHELQQMSKRFVIVIFFWGSVKRLRRKKVLMNENSAVWCQVTSNIQSHSSRYYSCYNLTDTHNSTTPHCVCWGNIRYICMYVFSHISLNLRLGIGAGPIRIHRATGHLLGWNQSTPGNHTPSFAYTTIQGKLQTLTQM